MCLDTLWSDELQKEWLKNQPKTITAYKVVEIKKGHKDKAFPPIYWDDGAFEKTNIERRQVFLMETDLGGDYRTFYHFFLTTEGAEKWIRSLIGTVPLMSLKILKCEIPKKCITAIGTQKNHTAIVAKQFTFIEGDEYFKGGK